jgi:hypothetical protein
MEPLEAELSDSIPVYCNGCFFFDYWVGNLFSRWGNGDGSDTRLEAIGGAVVSEIERAGFTVETVDWSAHNPLLISEIRRGELKWENRWARDIVDDCSELWESLPEGVKEVLCRLAREGINAGNTIYVCLIHDYWGFEDVLDCENWEELDDIDHRRYVREAAPRQIKLDSDLIPKAPFLSAVRNGSIELLEPLTEEEVVELVAYKLKHT